MFVEARAAVAMTARIPGAGHDDLLVFLADGGEEEGVGQEKQHRRAGDEGAAYQRFRRTVACRALKRA
jgi:hypothetical protein